MENGTFTRFRELTRRGRCRSALLQKASFAKDATLIFSARNLHKWTKYTGIDPEKRLRRRIDDQHADRFPGCAAADVLHLPTQRDFLTLCHPERSEDLLLSTSQKADPSAAPQDDSNRGYSHMSTYTWSSSARRCWSCRAATATIC
jgi:hypothetical protein